MVKYCCVKDCDSGRRHVNDVYHMFSVPKDENLFNKWKDVLALCGTSLKKSHYVCEKHFNKCDIRNKTVVTDGDGNILFQRNLQKVFLNKGAVPIISESSTNSVSSSLEIKVNVENIKSHSSESHEKGAISSISEDIEVATHAHDPHLDPSVDLESASVTTLPSLDNVDELFSDLFDGKIKPDLPDKSWSICMQDFPSKVVFQQIGTLLNSESAPWYKKQMVLNEKLNVQMYILGKFHAELTLGHTIKDLESLITHFNEMQICGGGPPSWQYRNVHLTCGYKDSSGKWRHNLCTLKVSHSSTCKSCATLDHTLRQHLLRRESVKNPQIVLSPSRKKKLDILRKARRVQAQALKRSRRRLNYILNEVEDLRKKTSDLESTSFETYLERLNLPEAQILLIKECVNVSRCAGNKGRRYTVEWLLNCILLRIRSPTAYNFLRDNGILPLPSRSTIYRYLRTVNVECGFNKDFFEALRKKLSTLPPMARHGVLLFDEMQIRKSISVNSKTVTFDGLTTTATDGKDLTMNDAADHALVFMFSSLGANFNQPIATFASKNATPGRVLAQLILQAIMKLEHAGAYVNGIICDGASTNRKMWTELGISGELENTSYSFENPYDDKRQVYVFSDAPHLVKCIRNRLLSKILKINGGYVEWTFFRRLYEVDCENPSHLRVCPKLTINHIYPTNCMKMRVSLATQVFSNSSANGLQFYAKRKPLKFKGCEHTIEFALVINDLFDALNRSFSAEGIRKGSKDFETLERSLHWLDSWERNLINGEITADQFLTKSTAEGLRVTIKSTIALCTHLLDSGDFIYVLTSKMNQDRLEQFFGIIRQAGCQNDHPTLPTFLQLYKLLSIYKLIKPPKFGNCSVQESTNKPSISLADVNIIFKKEPSHVAQHLEELKKKLDTTIETTDWECDEVFSMDHDYTQAHVVDCIVYYVTGFVCRKLIKRSKCDVCKRALIATSESYYEKSEAELVNIKTRGRLIHANKRLFHLFQATEKIFAQLLQSKRFDIYEATICEMLTNYKFSFPCAVHKEDVISYCLYYYITMRMRQWAKIQSQDAVKQSREKKKLAKQMQS